MDVWNISTVSFTFSLFYSDVTLIDQKCSFNHWFNQNSTIILSPSGRFQAQLAAEVDFFKCSKLNSYWLCMNMHLNKALSNWIWILLVCSNSSPKRDMTRAAFLSSNHDVVFYHPALHCDDGCFIFQISKASSYSFLKYYAPCVHFLINSLCIIML